MRNRTSLRFCWSVKLTHKKDLGLYDCQAKAEAAANLYKTLGYPNAKAVRI